MTTETNEPRHAKLTVHVGSLIADRPSPNNYINAMLIADTGLVWAMSVTSFSTFSTLTNLAILGQSSYKIYTLPSDVSANEFRDWVNQPNMQASLLTLVNYLAQTDLLFNDELELADTALQMQIAQLKNR